MKKEKGVITKEDTIEESSKKIQKKFKSLKEWAKLVKAVIIVYILFFIIFGIVDLIKINKEEVKNIDDFIRPDSGYLIRDAILDNETYEANVGVFDFNMNIENEFENKSMIMRVYVIEFILELASYIVCIIIYEFLIKIFEETEDCGTPFAEKNIKYLNIINGCCVYLFFLGVGNMSIGLVPLIIIEAMIFIVKYGNKLQNLFDETL